MRIVGLNPIDPDAHGVHTIDLWFSERRRCWIVERLDAEGHQIGLAARCDTEDDAADCLASWLDAHPETCLVARSDHRSPRAAARIVRDARHRAA